MNTSLIIDIEAAKIASCEEIANLLEGIELGRWDYVPAAITAQLSPQLGDEILVEGQDEEIIRVFQCDRRGTILPPSDEGRAAFAAVVDALASTPYEVRYEALNGSWGNLESVAQGGVVVYSYSNDPF